MQAWTGLLPSQQWDRLVGSARQIKEDFLSPQGPETLTVQLPAMGSRLIGGGLQTEVTRDEVQSLLVEGFLPRVELDSRPMTHATGFQEFGLPYASDPAITKHLAKFLHAHRDTVVPVAEVESWIGTILDWGSLIATACLRLCRWPVARVTVTGTLEKF